MKPDLVDRDDLAAKLRTWECGARSASAGVPQTTAGGVEQRIHNASAAAYASAATTIEQWPASTRYDELERTAKQALDLIASPAIRAMCQCDPDVGWVCYGCATEIAFRAAITNLAQESNPEPTLNEALAHNRKVLDQTDYERGGDLA